MSHSVLCSAVQNRNQLITILVQDRLLMRKVFSLKHSGSGRAENNRASAGRSSASAEAPAEEFGKCNGRNSEDSEPASQDALNEEAAGLALVSGLLVSGCCRNWLLGAGHLRSACCGDCMEYPSLCQPVTLPAAPCSIAASQSCGPSFAHCTPWYTRLEGAAT